MADLYGVNGDTISSSSPGNKNVLKPNLSIINENWQVWVSRYSDLYINPSHISLDTYEKMLMDDTVSSAIELIRSSVLDRLGEYTHNDNNIERFVRDVIEDMDTDIKFTISEILSAIWAGFSVTEIVWRKVGKYIGIAGLQTLHPRSVTFEIDTELNSPSKNNIRKILQWQYRTNRIELPQDKCIIYSHRKRFGNWYGESLLKSAYAPWFIKKEMLKAWAVAMERYGTPFLIGKVPVGNAQMDVGDGTTMTALEYMTMALQQLTATSVIAMDANSEVKIEGVSTPVGNDFDRFMSYLNKMIFRGIGLPSLIADHGTGGGSYALGQTHFDMFVMLLECILNDIAALLVDQLITPLILYNFGAQESYGKWRVQAFQVEDMQSKANAFFVLGNAGYMNPKHPSDWLHVRKAFGLSEETLDEFQSKLYEYDLNQANHEVDVATIHDAHIVRVAASKEYAVSSAKAMAMTMPLEGIPTVEPVETPSEKINNKANANSNANRNVPGGPRGVVTNGTDNRSTGNKQESTPRKSAKNTTGGYQGVKMPNVPNPLPDSSPGNVNGVNGIAGKAISPAANNRKIKLDEWNDEYARKVVMETSFKKNNGL